MGRVRVVHNMRKGLCNHARLGYFMCNVTNLQCAQHIMCVCVWGVCGVCVCVCGVCVCVCVFVCMCRDAGSKSVHSRR